MIPKSLEYKLKEAWEYEVEEQKKQVGQMLEEAKEEKVVTALKEKLKQLDGPFDQWLRKQLATIAYSILMRKEADSYNEMVASG